MLNEEHLLDGIAGICTNNGWTKVAEFTKVTYLNKLTKPTVKKFFLPLGNPKIDIPATLNGDYYVYLDGEICPTSYYAVEEHKDESHTLTFEQGVSGLCEVYYSAVQGTDSFDFYVAKHHVIKNISGNLFGMAMVSHINEQIQNTGCNVPFAVPDPDDEYGTGLAPHDMGVFSWAIQKAEEESLYERHTLYFYQLEKWISNGRFIVGWDKAADLKRLALDVEVQTSMWGSNESTKSLQFKVTDKFPQIYQSPIVTAHTRIPQLEQFEKVAMLDVKYTNWWEDSKVFVKGFVDGKSLMLIILADTAPVWDSNAVPSIPLYMGDFEVGGTTEEEVNREITFDFYRKTTKTSTVISSKPMINAGSTVKVWLMGDADGDMPDEAVTLKIAGQVIGAFNTTGAYDPSNRKEDAQFMGEFDITEIQGKNAVTIEAVSGDGVSGYNPAARMWLEITIKTDENAESAPSALFSGTAYSKEGADLEAALKKSAKFDYDDVNIKQEILLPILKEYPNYPSNGVDSVMVKRTKYGAKYQAHYLSWAVPPNNMPPLRQDEDDKKHPRAWNDYRNSQYKYNFNPSRYSEKAHSSRALLVHPEDGTYGTLRNVILVSPLTIMNGDELKAVRDHCDAENKYAVYSYYLVEGISPLTKRPATAFRPAGLGILKGGFTLPEIPPPPPEPPELLVSIDPASSNIEAGSSLRFTSLYSKHSPMTNFKWSAASDINKGSFSVDASIFTFNNAGTYTIKFTLWNELGQVGTAFATVVVNAKPTPPPPPPPPPPPNTLQCGQTNDTGGGAYTEKLHEMGSKAGQVTVSYDMYGYPDRIDVYYQNQLLATSNGFVSNRGALNFYYTPVGGVTQIKVVMSSESSGTNWEYLVNCPV
jgi:hypothetical protein